MRKVSISEIDFAARRRRVSHAISREYLVVIGSVETGFWTLA